MLFERRCRLTEDARGGPRVNTNYTQHPAFDSLKSRKDSGSFSRRRASGHQWTRAPPPADISERVWSIQYLDTVLPAPRWKSRGFISRPHRLPSVSRSSHFLTPALLSAVSHPLSLLSINLNLLPGLTAAIRRTVHTGGGKHSWLLLLSRIGSLHCAALITLGFCTEFKSHTTIWPSSFKLSYQMVAIDCGFLFVPAITSCSTGITCEKTWRRTVWWVFPKIEPTTSRLMCLFPWENRRLWFKLVLAVVKQASLRSRQAKKKGGIVLIIYSRL